MGEDCFGKIQLFMSLEISLGPGILIPTRDQTFGLMGPRSANWSGVVVVVVCVGGGCGIFLPHNYLSEPPPYAIF